MVDVVFAYQIALFASLVATAGIVAYTVRHRDAVGAVPLATLISGQFVWAACTLVSTAVPGTIVALVAAKLSYVGIVTVVAGLFVFALEFTGNDEFLGPKTYALLSVEPAGVMIGIWWNPDGLFWTTVGRTTTEVSGWMTVHGPLFWAHTAYSYALLGAAALLLVQFALRSETLYRQQVYGVLVGVFVPWLANALYLFGPIPFDPTPVAFSIVGIGLYWAVFSADFLEISPVAHSAMVDSIDAGVYVVDREDRVVELNDRGRRMLDVGEEADVVGRTVPELLGDDPELLERYSDLADVAEESAVEMQVGDRYVDVRVTPLYNDRDRLIGRVFLVYDVTRRKKRERELERRNRQLNWFASVVSHDLRNPLNVASGTLDLARETGDDEHFETVERSLDRMERLIEEMLVLAEDGDAATEALRLDDVARQAWEHVATGDAALSVETDRRLLANREQLLQLFENLYRNTVEHSSTNPDSPSARRDAVEHSSTSPRSPSAHEDAGTREASSEPSVANAPENAVEHSSTNPDSAPPRQDAVEHSLERSDAERAEADGAPPLSVTVGDLPDGFYVADDGPGIPESEREEVFEHGYSTGSAGSGLGLTIVEHVTSAHGWDVAATESEAGGARFEITGIDGAAALE